MFTEDDWIEIAERLPSDDDYVLLADSGTGLIAIGKIPNINGNERAVVSSCPGVMTSVTDWMPLPPPPIRKT